MVAQRRSRADVARELIAAFSFEGINRSNAVVNFTEEDPFDAKAVWLNAEHIRTMPVEDLSRSCCPSCAAPGSRWRRKMLQITPLIRERIRLLNDVLPSAIFSSPKNCRPTTPPN